MSGPARYWLATLYGWTVPTQLPSGCCWIKGQQETCPTTGRLHHQVIFGLSGPQRLSWLRSTFGGGHHYEPSRSSHADAYVWKDETAVEGTRFELGRKLLRRNSSVDWEQILSHAKEGNIGQIPADVQIRYYRSLKGIAADHHRPIGIEKTVNVFHGRTGTGKSRRAWEEAGVCAYPKDPRSKWFDGYKGEENIVIDEFRGTIDISHLLRWLDRYPVRVECKGSSVPLQATKIWITSNLAPTDWYPELDEQTREALLRRLNNIVEFE